MLELVDPEIIALLAKGTKHQAPRPSKSSKKRGIEQLGPVSPAPASKRQERPKAGNYKTKTIEKNVLQSTWSHFRATIATKDPFPSPEDSIMHALASWKKMAEKAGHPDLPMTNDHSTIVRHSYSSHCLPTDSL